MIFWPNFSPVLGPIFSVHTPPPSPTLASPPTISFHAPHPASTPTPPRLLVLTLIFHPFANYRYIVCNQQRLNMELVLDLQSLIGLHMHSYAVLIAAETISLEPESRNIPSPNLGSYTNVLLVSQDRRHLFVTPSWLPHILPPPPPALLFTLLHITANHPLNYLSFLYPLTSRFPLLSYTPY